MGTLKKRKNVLIVCIAILLLTVLTVGYYGVFIYPKKQSEKQQVIIDALEQEIDLSLPDSVVLHSNSKMELYTNAHDLEFCRFNIVGSFDKKEYDEFLLHLKNWEISGGDSWESQEEIMKNDPHYYENWKYEISGGTFEYEFFLRKIDIFNDGTDKNAKYSYYRHNQAIMIIKDKENDNYKMYLTAQIDVPECFKQDINIYYEIGRPQSESCFYGLC